MAEQQTGIDVSNHQNAAALNARRPIDWAEVAAAGMKFVWAKAVEGARPALGVPFFWDPFLAENTHGAMAEGIPAGGYDFARPQDPRDEARRFATYLRDNGLLEAHCLRPMLDVEDPAVGDAWIAAWIDEFRRVTGIRRVIVYASRDYWLNRLHPERWADDDVLLWLADYDYGTSSLKWNHRLLAVKQYRSDGSVPGLVGHIDMNVTVNGFSVADLTIGGDDMSVDELLDTEVEVRNADGTSTRKASIRQIFEWIGNEFNATREDDKSEEALAEIETLRDRLTRMEQKLDALTTGGVDVRTLANALAGPLGDHVRAALGAEVYNALLRVVTNTRLTVPGSGGL